MQYGIEKTNLRNGKAKGICLTDGKLIHSKTIFPNSTLLMQEETLVEQTLSFFPFVDWFIWQKYQRALGPLKP